MTATPTPLRAPVQGYAAGIPWSLHLEAYDAYCKKWRPQPAMIDPKVNCRGGFHVAELDEFIPGWRERASEMVELRARVAELEAALSARDEAGAVGEVSEGWCGADRCVKWNGKAPQPGTKLYATPPASGEAGDWYVSDEGSVCIDFDTNPARQLSLLCKRDGTVKFAAYIDGDRIIGNAMQPGFFDVLRRLAAVAPAGMDDPAKTAALADWLEQQMPGGTVISNPRWWAPRIMRVLAYIERNAAAPTPPATAGKE